MKLHKYLPRIAQGETERKIKSISYAFLHYLCPRKRDLHHVPRCSHCGNKGNARIGADHEDTNDTITEERR